MNLSSFSVKNPVAVNLMMWLIIGIGTYYAFNLVRQFLPNSEPEQIGVNVIYPGATPAEIEKAITRRLERELEGVDGVEEIESRIFEGLSTTILTLDDGADRNTVLSDIRGEMDSVTPELPEDAEEPELELLRPYFPVISVVVHGDVSEERLHDAAVEVKDDLLDLPGISRIVVTGQRAREIHAEILPERLEEHGLTFEEVGRELSALNLDAPGGTLKHGAGNVGVRTMGEEESALGIEELVVKSYPDGTTIRLRDIARVRATFEDRIERGRFWGRPAVLVTIFKTPEEDALQISSTVKEYVADHPTRFGGAITLGTTTDLSRFIEQRLDLMLRNAKWGLILVALMLALFLELKVAFWVAVGLPISFLGTFIAMRLFGLSINLITLFGLIVVLGLIVDDAIVIGENIFTKLRSGVRPRQAAIEGATEVAIPVVSAVLTTMVAFAPLAFIAGDMGSFLRELPLVVIAALGVSLIEAFLILPAHLAHEGRGADREIPVIGPAGRALQRFRANLFEHILPGIYEVVLRFCLKWRYAAIAFVIAFSMAAAGLMAGGVIRFALMQDDDAETLTADLEMAAGTSEKGTLRVIEELEEMAKGLPEIASVYAVLGASFGDRGRQAAADPATVGQITMELLPAEVRGERGMRSSMEILSDLRARAGGIPRVKRIVFAARGGGPQGADIEIRVRGDDLEILRRAVEEVNGELERYTGIEEIQDDLSLGKLEIRLQLRESARELGLSTRDLALQVRHALFGFEVQDLQRQNEEVKVRVLLPESARREIADLARLRIVTPDGDRVPLEEVALITTDRGYATIARLDGERTFTVKAEVDENAANVAEVTDALGERMKDIEQRIGGISLSFEGQKKETSESLGSLKIGFPVALFLIYAIVAILFRSYLQPLIVMAAIPYALVGAIVGHYITGYPFTLLSLIGGVALAGIVVNDSLILVDFINRRRREGMTVLDSVVAGGRARLRAIVLTSITTIAGLSPLMLEQSFQAQFLIPMAVSIVYGLAFGTVLTLLILPSFYLVFEDIRQLFGAREDRLRQREEALSR